MSVRMFFVIVSRRLLENGHVVLTRRKGRAGVPANLERSSLRRLAAALILRRTHVTYSRLIGFKAPLCLAWTTFKTSGFGRGVLRFVQISRLLSPGGSGACRCTKSRHNSRNCSASGRQATLRRCKRKDRKHFLALASKIMRLLVVNYARKNALQREGTEQDRFHLRMRLLCRTRSVATLVPGQSMVTASSEKLDRKRDREHRR